MSINAEKHLYVAVILQAISDATGRRSSLLNGRDIRVARDWFICAGPDFKEVCDLAGLDPDDVQKRALAAIAEADDGVNIFKKARGTEHQPIPRRAALTYLYKDEQMTMRQLADISGVDPTIIYGRLKAGWSVDDALITSKIKGRFARSRKCKSDDEPTKITIKTRGPSRRYEWQGEQLSVTAMAIKTDLPLTAVRARIAKGWSVERIMTTPLRGNS